MTNADAPIADVKRRFDVAPRYFGAAATVTALFYPLALVAFYSGGQMLGAASGWESELSAWIVTLAAAILVYGMPATSFWLILALGQLAAPSRAQVRARAWTHLAFASPPLFTAIGVLLYLLHWSSGDYIAWAAMWLAIFLVMLSTGHDQPVSATQPVAATRSAWLISAHGLSALTIVLVFLSPHIANHLTAIWSADLHKSVMDGLRTIYRSNVIQPALVTLLLFQIASGGALLRRRVGVQNDIFGSLQTAAGAYLGVFVVSHLTAVFVLGRQAMQVDTNWDFAIGAPAGMMGDPWNVRLVPHYSLAVFLLFSHVACGIRMVLLGRRVPPLAAARTAVAIIALGAAVALTVTLAMLGVHVGPRASMHGHSGFTPRFPAEQGAMITTHTLLCGGAMRDLLVQAAGVLGIAAALAHGYLGETKLFATARIEPSRARLLLRVVLHCSVVAWAAMGALLILVPTMGSGRARIAIISASAGVFAAAAIGNAWASRGRHFGWAWLSVVVGLALAGM